MRFNSIYESLCLIASKLKPVLTVLDMSEPACVPQTDSDHSQTNTDCHASLQFLFAHSPLSFFYWFSVGLSWPDHCNQPSSNKSSPSLKLIFGVVEIEASLWFGLCTSNRCTSGDRNTLSCCINRVYWMWWVFILSSTCFNWDTEKIFGNIGTHDKNVVMKSNFGMNLLKKKSITQEPGRFISFLLLL